jgi:cytochrome c oxidase subunit 2
MNYLSAYGSKANIVLPLTWGVLVIALVVTLIILFSVAAGTWRRGRSLSSQPISEIPVGGTGSGLNWIYIGVGLTSLVLIVTVFWTMSWTFKRAHRLIDAAVRDDASGVGTAGGCVGDRSR